MFKKRVARSLRQKTGGDSDDEKYSHKSDEENSEFVSSPAIMPRSLAYSSTLQQKPSSGDSSSDVTKLATRASTTSLLSFADEDAEEVDVAFKVKKSSQSRKLEKLRRKLKAEADIRQSVTGKADNHQAKTTTKTTATSGSGTNVATTVGKKPSQFTITSNLSTPDSIVVKAQDQKKLQYDAVILTGKDAEALDLAEEDNMNEFRKKLTGTDIPDARLIHLARKQRQLARDAGELPPTVTTSGSAPVDDTQRYRAPERSRLVREDDDNDRSDEDEGGNDDGDAELSGREEERFYSRTRNANDEARRRVEAEFLRTEQGSDEDNDDDEFAKWEQEQIRKGVSVQQITSYRQEQQAYFYYQQQAAYGPAYGYDVGYQHHEYSSSMLNPVPPPQPIDEAADGLKLDEPLPMDLDIELPTCADDEIPAATVAPLSERAGHRTMLPKWGGGQAAASKKRIDFEQLRMRIKERYDEQAHVVSSLTSDIEQNETHQRENANMVDNLRNAQPDLQRKLEFCQQLQSYCRDLLDCFNVKIEVIERLEERAMTQFYGRSNFLIRRRQQDVKDQFDEISLIASGRSQQKLDPDRMMRASEREARKNRRRQAREKSLAGIAHHDGMSSDDEEAPSRVANFNEELEKIRAESAELWDDVDDDYRSIDRIADRFSQWRSIDKTGYDRAYGDLCLQKLLAPIVRWNLITWNVFDANSCSGLENSDWYRACKRLDATFYPQNNNVTTNTNLNSCNKEHDDRKLIVDSVIEKVICPKLKDFVSKIWDPTSSQQSVRLSTFVKTHLLPRIYSIKPKFDEIIIEVEQRIKKSFEEDLFTPIYPKELLEDKTSGALAFLDRQFWISLKIAKNLLFWEKVMSNSQIQQLTIDGILNRYFVLNLQCSLPAEPSTLLKCKSVCNAFSTSAWFCNMPKEESASQLENLFKILYEICGKIKESKSYDRPETYDVIRDICRHMQKLKDSRFSSKLVDKYRLKL